MIWRSVFSPVTKRHIERQILHTHPLHLLRIIQDVDQYSRYGVISVWVSGIGRSFLSHTHTSGMHGRSFLPLCSHSKILRYAPLSTGTISSDDLLRFDATLTVGLPPLFQETYTSAVTVNLNELTVESKSISSKLFDSLYSCWKLTPVPCDDDDDRQRAPLCAVHFEVEMTVSDPLIVGTLDTVLEQVAGRQVQAFADRCQQIPMSRDLRQ
jgi:ribosome-associated toxin RatA of RatAB toxin-antitoxin module